MSTVVTPAVPPEGDLDWPVTSVGEAGVTELRVHGVGGTPPESMLGDPHPRQVTGDRLAGMWRGADQPIDGEARWHREAYSWGGLTSKAFVSALWLALLPFALFNLAGWTAVGQRGAAARPEPEGVPTPDGPAPGGQQVTEPDAAPPGAPDWRIGYQHSLVRIAGLAGTWTYVVFGALIAMDFGGWQCSRVATSCRLDRGWEWLGLTGHPARAAVVAAIVPVAVIAALAILSQETTRRYENYAAIDGKPELPLASIELTDQRLWLGGGYATRERTVHIASSLLVPAALLLFVADHGGRYATATATGLIAVACLAALSVLAASVNLVRALVCRTFWPPVLVGLAMLGFAATLAWLQPAREPGQPELMPGTLSTFNGLIVGVYTVALLLGVIALAASRRSGGNGWVGMTYGLPAPYLALVFAVLLLFAVWAGVAVWAARLMSNQAEPWPAGASSDAIVYPGAFGWLALLAVCLLVALLLGVGAAGLVASTRARRRAWQDLRWERGLWAGHDLPEASRVSGTEQQPSAWLRRIRWSQWLAGITRWIEMTLVIAVLLTTVAALGFSGWFTWQWFGWGLAGAVAGLLGLGAGLTILVRSVVERRQRVLGIGAAAAAVGAAATAGWWLSGMDDAIRPAATPLPSIGDFPVEGITTTVLTLVPIGSILLMRQAIASRNFRRSVCVAWDVATFWPRAFHPLAPPSYAERAVPELTMRIRGLLRRGHAVLLAGHSQGAVLTVAAAAQLTDLPAEQRQRFSVITYGNPVVNLYQRWFPTYVNQRVIERVTTLPGRWINFFRYTDPIGRELFGACRRSDADPPATSVPAERGDCWLPDPPTDLCRPGDGHPAVRGHGHDGYLRQSAFQGHLTAETRRLAALAAPAPAPAAPPPARVERLPDHEPTTTIAHELPDQELPGQRAAV